MWKNFINNISQSDIKFYPNINKTYLAIKKFFNIKSKDNIIIGSGSDRIIKYIFECFVSRKSEVITSEPCFPMYDVYSKLYEAKLIKIKYNKMKVDIDKVISSINSKTSIVILSNPSSPVGDIIEKNKIIELLNKCKKNNILLVIDEAYVEFSKYSSLINDTNKYSNLFVIRTFSKAYGSAGVRCGFGISNKKNIDIVNKFRDMYEISALTALWLDNLLKNKKSLNIYFTKIKKNRLNLYNSLKNKGYEVINSESNWIHLKVNKKIISLLNKNNFLVKDVTKLPLKNNKGWITISIPDDKIKYKSLIDIF